MKNIIRLLIFLIFLLIIWINLPDRFIFNKYKINFPKREINLNLFGLKIQKEFKTNLGLDLKGGARLIFLADTSKINSSDLEDAINSTRDIIEKRVNFFGVSEPSIQVVKSQSQYQIAVDLPGITDVDAAINLIGKTAQLSFKEEATTSAKIATDTPFFLRYNKETGLTGKDIKKAFVTFDPNTGKPQVGLQFTDKGKKLFGQITTRNVNKPLAIWLDQFLISMPTVQQPIIDGNAVITGNFNLEEAKKLAISINSGALPLPIKLISQTNIGPTLGEKEVRLSFYAGVIGLLMVIIFMIGYYGKFGVIAGIALLIYGLISLAIFKTLAVVLTLPGVAGFILSIGMAVDSNILIFERIKEELRKGKKFEIAVKLGFGKALDAIKDANITTLLVAFILFNPLNWDFLPQFGMVRGFALTLAIGVATSLFTGVVITKRLIQMFYKI